MTTLVDIASYRRFTGDQATPGSDVTAFLADAEAYANDTCNRTFAFGTYTETLDVYPDGKVYPSAPPIAAVTAPDVAAGAIQGFAVFLGYLDPTPLIAVGTWPTAVPAQATITYSGGYQPIGSGSAVTPVVPVKLARAISRIAYLMAHPSTGLAGMPAGVTAARLGDISVGGDLSAMGVLDKATSRDLRGFTRPQTRGWQT